MALVLTTEQKATVRVRAVTAGGNPASIDGAPLWGTSDATVLDVTPDPADPFQATATSVAAGAAQIQVTADADLSANVRVIAAQLDVTVTLPEAATLEITPGAPESK